MDKKEREAIRARCEAIPIAGYDGYFITPDGIVISTVPWRGHDFRILEQSPNKYGYMRVRLTVAGKRKPRYVHRLVADAYLQPRPSNCDQLRHLDGDKKNNKADNLEWGTAKSNASDRDRHGTTAKGEHNGFSYLHNIDVVIIRKLLSAGLSQRKIASLFGINQTTVGRINRGETWRHVG